MNMKNRIVIPILLSSVVLMLSAFVVMTQGTDTVNRDNIKQTHTTELVVAEGVA
ncbi:MAG: hypothetical protein U9Q75_01215 [Pseudomonadota bacterium]|nr:hypothetical protein [Pseudomonadota bacterium]